MGDPHNDEDNMEKPCEICGNIGFLNALRDCSMCNSTREHAYCRKVLPELPELRAEPWICEECESEKMPLSEPVPSKQPEDARTNYMIKKPPQNTKVQYITAEEVMALESEALKDNPTSPRKPYLSTRFRLSKASCPNRGPNRVTALPPDDHAKLDPQVGFQKSLNGGMPSSSSLKEKLSTSEEKGLASHLGKNTERDNTCSVHPCLKVVQGLAAVNSGCRGRSDGVAGGRMMYF